MSRNQQNGRNNGAPLQRLSGPEIERLYRRHGAALLLFARSYVADAGAAEDVVHRVFLRLLAGTYAQPDAAAAYLYRAVKNEALNNRRDRSRDTPFADDSRWFSEDGHADPAESLALQRAIAELPNEQRDAVVMRVWSGMTFEEVADATEVSVNTAASRFRYGLEKLRERLGERKIR